MSAATATPAATANNNVLGFSNLPKEFVIIENLNSNQQPNNTIMLRNLRSHRIVLIRNCADVTVEIQCNQRLSQIVVMNCQRVKVQVDDSVVVATKTLRAISCRECLFHLEDCDVRKVQLWRCDGCNVMVTNDDILAEQYRIFFGEGCNNNNNNKVTLQEMIPDAKSESGFAYHTRWSIVAPKTSSSQQHQQEEGGSASEENRNENRNMVAVVSLYPLDVPQSGFISNKMAPPQLASIPRDLSRFLLPAFPSDAADIDAGPSFSCEPLLRDIQHLLDNPPNNSKQATEQAFEDELAEVTEDYDMLKSKVAEVVKILQEALYVTCFSGAGISTSAPLSDGSTGISDFRGPNGIWSQRARGKSSSGKGDFFDASPTLCHYGLTELARRGILKHIVTTNMDGLQERSGLPLHMITCLHGSSYKATCPTCITSQMFPSLVEELGYGLYDHRTSHVCSFCGTQMNSTIVNFTETYRDATDPVLAAFHCNKSDVSIVLGTSMAVQPAVSYPLKALSHRSGKGKMILVNAQKTPADNLATVRIFSKTDVFMRELLRQLGVTQMDTSFDAREEEWTEKAVQARRHHEARKRTWPMKS